MKKFIVPVSLVGLITLLVVLYFVFFALTSPYKVIPGSALAVVETSDWSKLSKELNTRESAKALSSTTAAQRLSDEISFLGQLLSSNPEIKRTIYNDRITASLHLISAADFDYLFTISAKGMSIDDLIKVMVSQAGSASVIKRSFKGETLVDVSMKEGKRFSFTVIHHILCISFSPFLTETSITAFIEGDNLESSKELKKIRGKLKFGEEPRLFINFRKADVILPVLFKTEKLDLLSDIGSSQGWVGYTITFDTDRIHLNGVSVVKVGSQINSTENILASNIWNDIPDNAALVNVGFNMINEDGNGQPDPEKRMKAEFKGWVGEAHAFVTLEPLREDFTERNIFILQTKDGSKAIESLKHFISRDGSKEIPIDTFMNYEIFTLNDGALINRVFGNSLVTFQNSFFTVVKNVLIFSNNSDILKFTLEKISRAETLNKDASLLKSVGESKSGNTVIFINPAKSALLLSGMLKEGSTLQSYLSSLSSVSIISILSDEWNTTQVNFVNGNEHIIKGGLLWKTKLLAWSDYTPQIVLNYSTNEKEIFTQDTANNIYLISKSGEIIFTRNIGEKVIGGVHQLSLRDDQKYQYIFNTDAHVFVIDRSGSDVAGYPLRVGAQASAGLTLVNSDSRCSYYIPCNNGTIYGYEASGRPLPGWSPKKGVGVITKPLQNVEHKKGFLLLAFNNAGMLMLFSKRADLKWSVENLPVANTSYNVVRTADDFLVMNASGNELIEISSDGNDKIKPLVDSAYSFASLATSDTSFQYFFSSHHDVRSYTSTGAFLNAMSFKSSTIGGLDLLSMNGGDSSDHYLLIKDETAHKVIICDLGLKHLADYSVTNLNAFTITDLFDRKEMIGIQPDEHGNIECYRIK